MEDLEAVIRIDEELEPVEDPYVNRLPSQLKLVKEYREAVELPPPTGLRAPLFEVIARRRSERVFNPFKPVSLQSIANILFAAAGVTERRDGIYGILDYPLRASPSAGGLHCIDVYIAAFKVEGLDPGLYYYHYSAHRLGVVCRPCYPHALSESFAQGEFKNAPVAIFLVADLSRGMWKYGKAFYKYCLVDAGALAENMHLAATAEGLSSVMIAGFNRGAVAKALGLERHERPVLALALGYGVFD